MKRNACHRLVAATATVLLPLAIAACGDGGNDGSSDAAIALRDRIPQHGDEPGPQADRTYVGYLGDAGTLVAVVADGTASVAYVCDGAQLSEWFLGSVADGRLALAGEKGSSLTARLGSDSVAGTVALAATSLPFSALAAVEQESGLFRTVEEVDGERIVTGWIYYDGELRGADEDSGKSVVGSVSVGGIDTATGTGTGPAPSPTPAPFFDCNFNWCNMETQTCFIKRMSEELANAKTKATQTQIRRMRDATVERRNELFDLASENGCLSNQSACPDTGYDSLLDQPNCTGG
ncbi:MAG: hypothetical protein AB1689_00825 [Thermodesulfobacteriota bacterium]